MRNKKYNASLKEQYDQTGKNVTKQIMWDCLRSEHVCDNELEDSGDFSDGFWDQIYRLPGDKLIAIESEVKDQKWFGKEFIRKNWKYPFKYDSVDIPYRKKKNKATLFFVISSCENYAILVSKKSMEDSAKDGPKIKRTKWEPKGAPYYSVGLDNTKFVVKKNEKWWFLNA